MPPRLGQAHQGQARALPEVQGARLGCEGRSIADGQAEEEGDEGAGKGGVRKDDNAAYQMERYRERRRLGLCTQCPEKAEKGHTMCGAHLQAKRDLAAYRIKWAKVLHLCIQCGAKHASKVGGKTTTPRDATLCPKCRRYFADRQRQKSAPRA